MRLRRKRPLQAEHALEERGGEISRNLVERGLRDLDERSGFLGRLERRLVGKRDRQRGS